MQYRLAPLFCRPFGANATAYIAAFMRNIEWNAVPARYEDATKVAPPRPREQKEFAPRRSGARACGPTTTASTESSSRRLAA